MLFNLLCVSSLILARVLTPEFSRVPQLAEKKRSVAVAARTDRYTPHESRRIDEQAASGLEVLMFPS